MRTTTSLRVTNLALGTLLVGLAGVQAVGFRLPNQDPDAIARGNAFVATADNPAAIYYNPAGITQLQGHNVRAGLYMVRGGIEYESPTGMAYDADSEFLFVPQLYYVFSPKESPLSLGMGFYAPYGLSLDWGENAPFRTTAQKGELNYLTINPYWPSGFTLISSVGIGPTFNYSDATFKRGLACYPATCSSWRRRVGLRLSCRLRCEPHEKMGFGLNYRHLTTVDYKGIGRDLPPLRRSLPPQSGSASIRFPLMWWRSFVSADRGLESRVQY
jgi:long-chain fatty acid transport protein